MAEVVKKPLKITETVLRDAHQSLIATRMTTEQMLPIVDKMDKVVLLVLELMSTEWNLGKILRKRQLL